MRLPEFNTYCGKTTKGNALVFTIGDLDIYYSYRTPVAFRYKGKFYVRKNVWGPTTAKHLNAIDGGILRTKKARISGAEFEEALARVLSGPDTEEALRAVTGSSIVDDSEEHVSLSLTRDEYNLVLDALGASR